MDSLFFVGAFLLIILYTIFFSAIQKNWNKWEQQLENSHKIYKSQCKCKWTNGWMNKPIDGKKENKNLEEFLKYTRINEANAYYDFNLSKFSYFYVQNLKIIVVCLSVCRPACLSNFCKKNLVGSLLHALIFVRCFSFPYHVIVLVLNRKPDFFFVMDCFSCAVCQWWRLR